MTLPKWKGGRVVIVRYQSMLSIQIRKMNHVKAHVDVRILSSIQIQKMNHVSEQIEVGRTLLKRSDSEDEFRYRTWRSEKNHVKHSDSGDESHSEDELRYRARRSEKNHVKHSGSEDVSHSKDESRKRAGRSEKNLVQHSDSEDESRNRARRGEKNQPIKIGRDDGQGNAKGKHDNLELEKYPMKDRNESQYRRRKSCWAKGDNPVFMVLRGEEAQQLRSVYVAEHII
ncbi:PREDICTED: pre-mRNA-splicing factor CWC25 homolog [Prunus dulcis]|uniref:PREDICTED: pre-mRNA-splicing factor CWC25 homolog n=1 Tax=Prunus dulcis TaxID=3755 RepID=A0A5E4G2T9_PRUDU|nr:PREDICTED: pre-mRNA-splicing factor CWC25 homolog [Prunus dulcis]